MIAEVLTKNMPFLMTGLLITLKVAFLSIILSLIFGMALGTVRFAKIPILSFLTKVFVDITRSIPLILYIIFIHFSISPYLYEHANFLKYIGIDCLEMYSAIIAIVAFNSAYIAEIIRAGLESVEKEQIIAAKALALTKFQIIESIILPQAITRMKPAICAQLITLIKDTSLASTIGLIEFTRSAEIVYETSLHEFQILAFVALVYVSINFSVQKIFYPQKKLLTT